MTKKIKILICDDDDFFVSLVQQALSPSFQLSAVSDSDQAIAKIQNEKFDLLLLDVAMRFPTEGLDAIPKIRQTDPDLAVVILSGNVEFDLLRRAMRLGAWDYVGKDFQPQDLKHAIERVLEKSSLLKQRSQQTQELKGTLARHVLVGTSAPMEKLRRLIERARDHSGNVVITGETGTGKEAVARFLRKTRADDSLEPFVSLDSSTIQSSTAESALFGHIKGAFTGADQLRKGIFEEADGGVVYFDEIANMPLSIQSKLLRVVQEKEVVRLGCSKPLQLEFRVVCASNRDLEQMVERGEFKDDLLQRLNVIPLSVPPLRERMEDLPLLISHFSQKEKPGFAPLQFSEEAMSLLNRYHWPGNVRELGNLVAYLYAMGDSFQVEAMDLPPKISSLMSDTHDEKSSGVGTGLQERLMEYEKKILTQEFSEAQGNVGSMAKKLRVDRSNLYRKLKGYRILASSE